MKIATLAEREHFLNLYRSFQEFLSLTDSTIHAEPKEIDAVAENLLQSRRVILDEKGFAIVDYEAKRPFFRKKTGEITGLFVDERDRGNGLGGLLLLGAEQKLMQEGCRNLVILVDEENVRCIDFL